MLSNVAFFFFKPLESNRRNAEILFTGKAFTQIKAADLLQYTGFKSGMGLQKNCSVIFRSSKERIYYSIFLLPVLEQVQNRQRN